MKTKKENQELFSAQELIDFLVHSKDDSERLHIQKILERYGNHQLPKIKFDDLTPKELSAVLKHHYIFDNHTNERCRDDKRYLILFEGQKSEVGNKEVDKYYIPNDLKKMGDFGNSELLCRLIFYSGSCEENGPMEKLFHKIIEPNFKD